MWEEELLQEAGEVNIAFVFVWFCFGVFFFLQHTYAGCLIFIISFISNGLEVANFVALLISSRRSRGITGCARVYDSSLDKEAHQVPLSQFL